MSKRSHVLILSAYKRDWKLTLQLERIVQCMFRCVSLGLYRERDSVLRGIKHRSSKLFFQRNRDSVTHSHSVFNLKKIEVDIITTQSDLEWLREEVNSIWSEYVCTGWHFCV